MTFSFKQFALVCVCVAGFAFADENSSDEFYAKDQVKAFFSVKAQYEQLSSSAISAINYMAFGSGWGFASIGKDSLGNADTTWYQDSRLRHYNQFGNNIMGLGLEFGGQYHQLITWLDVSFMPNQVSPVPTLTGTQAQPYAKYGDSLPSLTDVEWNRYGFDLMLGYMLAPPTSPINIIPSLGVGFNLLNVQFASSYTLAYGNAPDANMADYSLGRRFYSDFGKDLVAQLELRFNLGVGISVGAYAGYKWIWYDRFIAETGSTSIYFLDATSEFSGDSWYLGGKVTYTLPSLFETKQKEKF